MKLSKEKRDKLIVTVLMSAVAVFLIKGTLMGIQDRKIEQLKKTLNETEKKATEAQRIVGMRGVIKSQLEEAQRTVNEVEGSMPTEGNAYAWITQTINNYRNERAAQYGHLEFKDFQPPIFQDIGILPTKSITSEKGIPYKGARFRISGTGYYHDLGKFLADFENDFRYMRFENFTLAALSEGNAGEVDAAGGSQSELLQFRMEVVCPVLSPNS